MHTINKERRQIQMENERRIRNTVLFIMSIILVTLSSFFVGNPLYPNERYGKGIRVKFQTFGSEIFLNF